MMIDIDPHEDLYRIIALLVIIAILAFLVYRTVIPVEQFYAAVSTVIGYLIGRVRGKK